MPVRALPQVGHRDRLPGQRARRLLPNPLDRIGQPREAGRAVRPQRPLPGDMQAVGQGEVVEPVGQGSPLTGFFRG